MPHLALVNNLQDKLWNTVLLGGHVKENSLAVGRRVGLGGSVAREPLEGRCPMKRSLACFVAVLAFGMLAGCGGRHSAAGFRLPENGDVERGKAAFVELKCTSCHTVAGVDLPPPTMVGLRIPLGGEVYEARTDGYLVTSMIHPSHRLAYIFRAVRREPEDQSHMPDYTRSMTVRQMVDLVAFLQSTYEIVDPPPTMY